MTPWAMSWLRSETGGGLVLADSVLEVACSVVGKGRAASNDSRLRTAESVDLERPRLMSAVMYNWNARSERKSGDPGSCTED